MTPEQRARVEIDRLLQAAGWHVCDYAVADIHAARGVAIREFPLSEGHAFADHIFYVDGNVGGVIEAKKAGVPLVGVERQSARHTKGLPGNLSAGRQQLPFAYESTDIETSVTNGLDPEPICTLRRGQPDDKFSHEPSQYGRDAVVMHPLRMLMRRFGHFRKYTTVRTPRRETCR